MMNRALFIGSIGMIFSVVATVASSAAEPTSPDTAESILVAAASDERPVSKRQLTFQRSQEAWPMQLFAADPALLAQKYVAVVELVMPARQRYGVRLSDELKDLFYYENFSLIEGSMRASVFAGGTAAPEPKMDFFERLAANIPQDQLPPDELLSFFSTDRPDGFLQFRYQTPQWFRFSILATTQQRAEELADTLIFLLDNGLTRIAQIEIANQIKELEQQRQPYLRERDQFEAEVLDLSRQLKEFDDFEEISAEALADLATQRRLLSVDLAGIAARIDACNEILQRRNELPTGRIEQVETIKIAAEIELVGLTARMQAIGNIVDRGRRHNDLTKTISQKNRDIASHVRVIDRIPEMISRIREASKRYEPFALVDDKVMIRPILWQPASP